MKQDPRFQVRVSPVIVGASQSQDIEIDNVPVSMDPQSIARLLRSMDPSIPEDIADSIIVKAPLPGVGLKGVNEVTTATIAEFPIGDRLLQRLRNADGVHSQDGTEQWFVRPEIINNDAGRPCIQIIPTELECALLGLLEACLRPHIRTTLPVTLCHLSLQGEQ